MVEVGKVVSKFRLAEGSGDWCYEACEDYGV